MFSSRPYHARCMAGNETHSDWKPSPDKNWWVDQLDKDAERLDRRGNSVTPSVWKVFTKRMPWHSRCLGAERQQQGENRKGGGKSKDNGQEHKGAAQARKPRERLGGVEHCLECIRFCKQLQWPPPFLGPSHPRDAKVGQKALRPQVLVNQVAKQKDVAKERKNLTPQPW